MYKPYQEHWWMYCQRFSCVNTARKLTDEEVICVCIGDVISKRREIEGLFMTIQRHLREVVSELTVLPRLRTAVELSVTGVYGLLLEAIQEAFMTEGYTNTGARWIQYRFA